MSTSELPGFDLALSLPSPTTSPFACTFPSPPASPLRSTSSTPSPSPYRSSFPSLSFPHASSIPSPAPNSASVPGAIPTSTLTTLASIPDAPAQRVVRKPAGATVAGPPPAFPYNARYPPPDPADPFAPLSVLRSRTSSTCPPTPASVQPPAPYASANRTPFGRRDGAESDASTSVSTRRRKRSAFDFGLLPFPKDEREREKGREREQGRTFALTRGFGPSFGAGTSRASLPLVAQMEMQAQAQDQYMSDQEVRASRRTSAGLADRHGCDSDGLHPAWDPDRTHLDRHVGAARQLSTTGADPRRRSHSAFAAPLRPRPASVAVSPSVSASSSSGSGPRLALIAASASRSESDSSDSAAWSLADPVMPPILPWLPSGLERKLDGPRASAVKRESFVHVRGGKASRHSSASSISSTSLYSTRALSAASSASSSAPASAAFSVSVKLSSQDQDQDQDQNADQQQDHFSMSPHARQLYQYKDQDPKQQDLYQHQHHPSNSSNHVPSVVVAPNTFIASPVVLQRPTPAVDAPPLSSTRPPSPRIASVPISTPSAFAITPSASATTPSQLSSAPESTSLPVAISVPASASASVSALTPVATASTSHSIAESNCQIELKPDVHASAPTDADTAALFASAAVSLTPAEGRRLHILQVDPPPPSSTSASNIITPVLLGARVPVSTSAAAASPPARVRTPIYLPLPVPSPVPQLSKRHSSPPASPADHFFVGSPTEESVHRTTHIITAISTENQKPRQTRTPAPTPPLSRSNSKKRAVSMDNLRLKGSSPVFFSLSKPSSALVSATPARGTNTDNGVKETTGASGNTTARVNRKSISGMSISSPLLSSSSVPMPVLSRSPTPSQPTVDIISITAPSTINSVSRASSPAPTPLPKGAAPPRLHQQNKQEQQYSAPPLLARARTLSFASRLRRTSQNASHSPSPVPSISASVTGAQHAQRTRAETQLNRATSPARTTTPAITESVRSALPQNTVMSRNPTPIPALHSRSQTPAYTHSHLSTQTSAPHAHSHDHVPPFQGDALPARAQLAAAAALPVIAESGVRIPFGDLWADARTVVLFIRHFWCPLCQDYLFSVAREVEYARLRAAGVRLIIVGCGSYGLIKSYRQIFHMPYPIYTDPSLRLHRALGMTLRASPTNSPSTPNFPHIPPPPTTVHSTPPSAPSFPFSSSDSHAKQNYVKHGLMGGFAMVVRHALRVGMPVWERGGDAAQLGGEFVLGPGLTCMYAHRMRTRRGHEPILTVLSAAGVSLPHWYAASSAISATSTSTSSSASTTRNHVVLDEQEARWMAARRRSLARMRSRKAKRRGEIASFDDYDSEDVNGGDYEYAMYEEGEEGEEVVLIERKSVDAKEGSREVEMGGRKRDETWEGKILSIVPEEAGTAISSTRNSSLVAEDGQTIDGDSNSGESGVIVGLGRGDRDNDQEGRWVADADGLVRRVGGEGDGEGVKEIRGWAM